MEVVACRCTDLWQSRFTWRTNQSEKRSELRRHKFSMVQLCSIIDYVKQASPAVASSIFNVFSIASVYKSSLSCFIEPQRNSPQFLIQLSISSHLPPAFLYIFAPFWGYFHPIPQVMIALTTFCHGSQSSAASSPACGVSGCCFVDYGVARCDLAAHIHLTIKVKAMSSDLSHWRELTVRLFLERE